MHDRQEEILRKLEKDLGLLLEETTPLERALMLAKAFGEVYGERWNIEAKDDGSFAIQKDAPHA